MADWIEIVKIAGRLALSIGGPTGVLFAVSSLPGAVVRFLEGAAEIPPAFVRAQRAWKGAKDDQN